MLRPKHYLSKYLADFELGTKHHSRQEIHVVRVEVLLAGTQVVRQLLRIGGSNGRLLSGAVNLAVQCCSSPNSPGASLSLQPAVHRHRLRTFLMPCCCRMAAMLVLATSSAKALSRNTQVVSPEGASC